MGYWSYSSSTKKHNVKDLSSQLQLFLTKNEEVIVSSSEKSDNIEKKGNPATAYNNNYGEVWFKRMEAEWKIVNCNWHWFGTATDDVPQGPGVPPTWGQNQSLGCQTGDSIQLYPNYLPSIFSWLNLS